MIITALTLDPSQIHTIQAINQTCCLHDHTQLSYPFEEAVIHYLYLLPDQTVAGALALVPLEEDLMECAGFTLPKFRQKGIFSQLLQQALLKAEACDLLFQVPDGCQEAKAIMGHLDAQLLSTEHQMVLSLARTGFDPSLIHPKNHLSLSPTGTKEQLIWHLKQQDQLVGTCETLSLSATSVCLHHVEIQEAIRGQGFGWDFLCLLLSQLQTDGIDQVLLHVSAQNLPALALYKKAGFRITETLLSFIY